MRVMEWPASGSWRPHGRAGPGVAALIFPPGATREGYHENRDPQALALPTTLQARGLADPPRTLLK